MSVTYGMQYLKLNFSKYSILSCPNFPKLINVLVQDAEISRIYTNKKKH